MSQVAVLLTIGSGENLAVEKCVGAGERGAEDSVVESVLYFYFSMVLEIKRRLSFHHLTNSFLMTSLSSLYI